MSVKNIIFSVNYNPLATDIGLLFLRIGMGLFIAFGHGLSKFPISEGFIQGVGELGFPFPAFFAWSAALSEFVGGIFIAIGLLTRPAAFFVTFTMLVAGFLRHADDPFSVKEKTFLFAFIAIFLLLVGPGRYSVDARIGK